MGNQRQEAPGISQPGPCRSNNNNKTKQSKETKTNAVSNMEEGMWGLTSEVALWPLHMFSHTDSANNVTGTGCVTQQQSLPGVLKASHMMVAPQQHTQMVPSCSQGPFPLEGAAIRKTATTSPLALCVCHWVLSSTAFAMELYSYVRGGHALHLPTDGQREEVLCRNTCF